MQSTFATAQTEQWSWMVTQLWSWIWSGMSWILDLQHLVFGYVLGGGAPALITLKAALLLLPAAVLIVSILAVPSLFAAITPAAVAGRCVVGPCRSRAATSQASAAIPALSSKG